MLKSNKAKKVWPTKKHISKAGVRAGAVKD